NITNKYTHKEPGQTADKHKKNVFCKKQIVLYNKDCKKMIDETKKNNVIFMAGHVMNFMNGVRKAKSLINNGQMGDILFGHAERNGGEEPKKTISGKKMVDKSEGNLYNIIQELNL